MRWTPSGAGASSLKFQPAHAPLYLVFPDEAALPRIRLALSRAYLPEAGVRDLLSLTRPPRRLVPPEPTA